MVNVVGDLATCAADASVGGGTAKQSFTCSSFTPIHNRDANGIQLSKDVVPLLGFVPPFDVVPFYIVTNCNMKNFGLSSTAVNGTRQTH